MPDGQDSCSQRKAKPKGKQRLESRCHPQSGTQARGALPPFPFVKTCLACHANKVFETNQVKSMWRGRRGSLSRRSTWGGSGGVRHDAGSPWRAQADGASSQCGAEREESAVCWGIGDATSPGCTNGAEGADPRSCPRAEQGPAGSFRQRHMAACRLPRSPPSTRLQLTETIFFV